MNNDLISREAAIEAIKSYCMDCNNYNGSRCRACNFDDAMIAIDDIPAVDDEPVRHEKCDFCGRGKPIKAYTYLPDCGLQYGIAIEAIYCPKCGKKMDRGAEK